MYCRAFAQETGVPVLVDNGSQIVEGKKVIRWEVIRQEASGPESRHMKFISGSVPDSQLQKHRQADVGGFF